MPGRKIGKITPAELKAAFDLLGRPERALAKAAAYIVDVMHKPAINKVSVDMDGIEKANVDNYWPLERYRKGWLAGKQTYRISLLESQGWLQERVGGNDPVVIRDFFERLTEQRNAVAEYVGMAKPLRAATMVLNYGPVVDAIDAKGYQEDRRLINKIFESMQSTPRDDNVISVALRPIIRGATRAVLTSPQIIASQYTSVALYFVDADPKYLTALRVKATKKDYEEMFDVFPIGWKRLIMGQSSVAMGDIRSSDSVLKAMTGKSGLINLQLEGIHRADGLAIMDGFRIAKAEIKDTRPDLKKGSDAWKTAVRRRTDYLVRRSQPMFDPEGRSVLTVSPGAVVKQFVMFRSYIDQVVRTVHRAHTARVNKNISNVEYLRRIGTVYAALAANILLRMGIGWVLYDERKDIYDVLTEMVLAPVKLAGFVGHQAYRVGKIFADILRRKQRVWTRAEFDTLLDTVVVTTVQGANDFSAGAGYAARGDDEKAKKAIKRGIGNIAEGVGMGLGVPTWQIKRAKKGIQKRLGLEDKKKTSGRRTRAKAI